MKRLVLALAVLALVIPGLVYAFPEKLKTVVTYRGSAMSMRESISGNGQLTYAAFSGACKTDKDRQRALAGLPPARPGKGNNCLLLALGSVPNAVPNAGRTHILDGMASSSFDFAKYQGWGTSTQATASSDTGCVSEATTQYTSNNTRGTGTKSVTGFVLSVVATTNFDENITVNEFCLMNNVSVGSGVVWTRIVLPSSIVNPSSIVGTYELTVN